MSSSWGSSWGAAWANAWGTYSNDPSEPTSTYYWTGTLWQQITKQPKVYDGTNWVSVGNVKTYDGSTWN